MLARLRARGLNALRTSGYDLGSGARDIGAADPRQGQRSAGADRLRPPAVPCVRFQGVDVATDGDRPAHSPPHPHRPHRGTERRSCGSTEHGSRSRDAPPACAAGRRRRSPCRHTAARIQATESIEPFRTCSAPLPSGRWRPSARYETATSSAAKVVRAKTRSPSSQAEAAAPSGVAPFQQVRSFACPPIRSAMNATPLGSPFR